MNSGLNWILSEWSHRTSYGNLKPLSMSYGEPEEPAEALRNLWNLTIETSLVLEGESRC